MFEEFYKETKAPFSGIWLDMNEIANFNHGSEHEKDFYDDIPYKPGFDNLRYKTTAMDAVHYGGIEEYNVHELFSILQNKATYNYLRKRTKLPFILTRSTSPGTGQFAAHWTGDNGSSWRFLQISIAGNFLFQIFGMPFVGADICGFFDDTTGELCARWIQVGALYPFARNHNRDQPKDQEPWAFKERRERDGDKMLEAYRASGKFRYSILKWFYSLFIATRGSGTVWRPLSFEFPDEEILYTDDHINERQLLLGSSMMATPCVEQGHTKVKAYFPKDDWFDFLSGQRIITEERENRKVEIDAPFNAPAPIFIRAGHIVHSQDVSNVLSTDDLNDEFLLNIAFKKAKNENKWEAAGSIMGVKKFDDDTIYDKCVEKNCLYNIRATIKEVSPTMIYSEIEFKVEDPSAAGQLEELKIYGFKLYGLPLVFFEEDNKKMGYGVAQSFDNTLKPLGQVLTVKAESPYPGTFHVPLPEKISVKGGDIIKLEILI